MNANEQNLIQYVIDGDIRKAQEQAKSFWITRTLPRIAFSKKQCYEKCL
jgi:hypothetical protein